MSRLALFLLPALATGYSWASSVCEVLDHRLELNGKQVEVAGHLNGGPYSGFFICGNIHCDPCVNRWIFSWPSALGLASTEHTLSKLPPELEKKYTGKPVDIVVKGRLFTHQDYYVINLPWRPNRPFGRYSWGGVAAAIEVSDIKLIPNSQVPKR